MNTLVEENSLGVTETYFLFSWGPVLAGVFAALSIQVALSVLGIGLGMATVNPMTQYNPLSGLTHFAGYWWIISGLFSLAIGAFVAAYLSETDSEYEGETVGFITWSVVNMIGVFAVLATAGGALDTGGKLIGGTLSTVVSAGSKVAPTVAEQVQMYLPADLKSIDTNQMRSELDLLMKGNSNSDKGLTEAFDRAFNQNGGVSNPANKESLANLVASRSSVSRNDAMNSINKWEASYNDAKVKFEKAKAEAEQKAREVGKATAKATSAGALIVFFTLMLGLATSLFAGKLGVYYRSPEVAIRFI